MLFPKKKSKNEIARTEGYKLLDSDAFRTQNIDLNSTICLIMLRIQS